MRSEYLTGVDGGRSVVAGFLLSTVLEDRSDCSQLF